GWLLRRYTRRRQTVSAYLLDAFSVTDSTLIRRFLSQLVLSSLDGPNPNLENSAVVRDMVFCASSDFSVMSPSFLGHLRWTDFAEARWSDLFASQFPRLSDSSIDTRTAGAAFDLLKAAFGSDESLRGLIVALATMLPHITASRRR